MFKVGNITIQIFNPTISTEDIFAAARKLKLKESVIANNPSDQEIVCFQMGEEKEPALLIIAGAHGDEPSGPLGADLEVEAVFQI